MMMRVERVGTQEFIHIPRNEILEVLLGKTLYHHLDLRCAERARVGDSIPERFFAELGSEHELRIRIDWPEPPKPASRRFRDSRVPHDIAEAMLETGLPYHDTSVRENILPLLAWRRRTPPNATIESLSTAADAAPGCDATTLALPGYTDFRP